METLEGLRPETTEALPLRMSHHRVSTLLLRFVGILFLTVTALAYLWSR
ncbi:MAG: hypothetical protein JOY90_00385 [Bradyrhizobium sp.]|jgi:hypothetical protein|nr:hypothetical protein [Bradyrhizobium sp.]MBV9558912.1 hypothetical protein [Bradyrhizobium sp.]